MKYDEDAYDDLREGLKIDRNALDEEAIQQPSAFFHASEGFAMAVSRRDKWKLDLEVETAQLDRDIRDNAAAEGEKITEKKIEQQLTLEPDYKRAHNAYLDACLESDRWQALQNSYRQRADMLRGLIQLHQTGYFGEVTGASERRDARERFDERRHR